MAIQGAFQPMGKTYKLGANTTSQMVTVSADSFAGQYMFASHENSASGLPVYVRISTLSNLTITAPATGVPSYAIPIPQDSVVVLTGPQCSPTSNVYIYFISESGTPEVYVTPGEGR